MSIESSAVETDHDRAKFYYGWVMLPLSMLALMATSVGQTYGISAFNKEIGHSLTLTETELAKAYMLGTILGALPISWFGYLMDRYGLRRTVLSTISLLSLACFCLAIAQNFTTLVLAFCFLRMLGPGTLAMLSGNMLAFWFQRRLGTVESLRKLSLSVAMGGVPALNYWLLKSFSWQQVQWLWGGVIWLGLFPLFFFLFRNRPEEVGQSLESRKKFAPDQILPTHVGLSLQEAVKTSAFWALTLGGALFALVMTAIVFNRISILESQGLEEWQSAMMMTVLSTAWAMTQFFSGYLVDRMPAKPLMILGHIFFASGIFCLAKTDSTMLVVIAGMLMGIGQGFYSGASHPLWARQFGTRHLGKITGVWMTMMVAASASGPYLAGLVRDFTGSFHVSLIILSLIPLPVILQTLIADLSPAVLRNGQMLPTEN